MSDVAIKTEDMPDLEELHERAKAFHNTFSYAKPDGISNARGAVALARTDLMRARVVILKKGGGENNLHYHTSSDSFWMVIRGRAKFYGPGDELIGEFGPMQGMTTPRYFKYWFENSGEEELEMFHLFAMAKPGIDKTGRTDAAPPKAYRPHSADQFDGAKK